MKGLAKMTDLRRAYHKTEQPKLDHLVQMVVDELLDSTVYLLIGSAAHEKSKLMLSVAVDLLKNNAQCKIAYVKAPTGLFYGHVTLHDDINTPYLPEFWLLYEWLFQVAGEETTKAWLASGRLTVSTANDFNDLVQEADVVLLDEIHNMNIKMVHQMIEAHGLAQKVLMTYESENAIFTDLVINEFESILRDKRPESNLKFMLIREREYNAIKENPQLSTKTLFEHMHITEIDMDVMDHDHMTHLKLDVKDNYLELRDTHEAAIKPVLLEENEVVETDTLEDEIQIMPLTEAIGLEKEIRLINGSAFWGKEANASFDSLLAGVDHPNGILNEDEIELQEIVMEKVSSDFWGEYKVHVLKALTVYEPEQSDWKNLRKSPRDQGEAKEGKLQLSLDSQNRYLVGKLVGANLFDSNQKIIARKGEVITTEIVEKATLSNVLVELILNMTLPELEGTYE